MRTLLYAMPSSGATYVAWTMSQHEKTIGILDMCKGYCVRPSDCPPGRDVLVKDTAGGIRRRNYKKWLDLFCPDRVVIVVRNESDLRESLRRRFAEAKVPERFLLHGLKSTDAMLREIDDAIKMNCHDDIVEYEKVAESKPPLHRSLVQIAIDNHLYCKWCRKNSRPQKWGYGGIHMPREDAVFLFHIVRYYGLVLEGSTRMRRGFVRAGLYVPPRIKVKA